MKNYEATGKTYEEALENGLAALGATISDVDITLLEEGSKGLFGLFGSRPYKVRLTLKTVEDDPLADLFRKEEPKKAPKQEKKTEPKPAKKPEAPKAEEKKEDKAERPAPVQRKAKPAKVESPAEEVVEAAEEAAEETESTEGKTVVKKSRSRNRNRRRGGKKNHTEVAETTEVAEEAPARELPPKEVKPIVKPVVTMIPDDQVDPDSAAGKAKAFLAELTAMMGVNVEIAVGNDEEGNVFVQMTGDTLGILIGRRGETLDAIQYLTSLKVNRGQEGYTRVTIDTENYRAKREDTLIRLANRMANRAVKTGRKVSMEPMNPYERRIIHSALQANQAVDTHSEGEEPNRHVVITIRK
ncbi:MAG: Jag N-terminal domain-containing protein [Clostridia bacterium]|nr:Jag N-terminal domain-containing protein [Clostridia bacterium]